MAAIVLAEDEMMKADTILANKILQLLKAPKILRDLGESFGKFAKPNAAKDMAEMILLVARRQGRRR